MNSAKKMMIVFSAMFFMINLLGFFNENTEKIRMISSSNDVNKFSFKQGYDEFKKAFSGAIGLSAPKAADSDLSEIEIYSNVNLYGFEGFLKSGKEFAVVESLDAHEALAGEGAPASGLGVFPFIAIAILINMLIQAIGWWVMNNLTQTQWDVHRIPREDRGVD